MKEFAADYDPKTNSYSVEHHDVFKQLAKEKDVARCIKLKQLNVGVQISLDQGLTVPKPEAVKSAAKDAATKLGDKAREEINALVSKLDKLQKDEKSGNKKAAAEGEKAVKDARKKIDTLAADFGPEIREAVEAAVKDQKGGKVKARSANRSSFRALELVDDFFQEKPDSVEDKPEFGKLIKILANSGEEIAGLTETEKQSRKDLADEIRGVQTTVEQLKGNKKDFDLKEFGKSHAKETRQLEILADKYVDLVADMSDKIDALERQLKQFNKLLSGTKDLQEQKTIEKHFGDYEKALATIKSTIKDKTDAAESAQHLLDGDYKNGEAWKKLLSWLDSIKAAAKSGGILKSSGSALEKIAQA